MFDELNLHHYMNQTGRCWAGLTRGMDGAAAANYFSHRARHRERFATLLGDAQHDFLACVEAYTTAYFEANGFVVPADWRVAHFGHNLALQLHVYPDFPGRVKIIHVTNRIFTWLATINHRMTWDSLAATKFWIAQTLLWKHLLASGNLTACEVAYEDYAEAPEPVRARLAQFIGTSNPAPVARQPGFIRFDPTAWRGTLQRVDELRRIYAGHPLLRAAESLDQWQGAFLADPVNRGLLDEYLEYWNTSAHTNFDWIGPIEENLIARIHLPDAQVNEGQRLNLRFYHEWIELHSDNYDRPASQVRHPLGSVERHLMVPAMPYFIRAVIAYLAGLCEHYERFLHSYTPLRESDAYLALNQDAIRQTIVQTGITPAWEALEKAIDRIDALVAGSRHQRNHGART